MLSHACLLLLTFSFLFSIVLTLLVEEIADLYASRAYVCLSCIRFFFVFVFTFYSLLRIVALPGLI